MNFMEPEAVTEVGNIPGTAVQTRATFLRIALLASNKKKGNFTGKYFTLALIFIIPVKVRLSTPRARNMH